MPTETPFLIRIRMIAVLLSLMMPALAPGEIRTPDHSQVPGIVIAHSPASSGLYIGSPSIAILPDGTYVASHDFFGPNANLQNASSVVFASKDKGKTWQKLSDISPLFWGKLFVHKDKLYFLGTRGRCLDVLIRRSDDGGRNWTSPDTPATGLLRQGSYGGAPSNVLIHNGRVWRAMDFLVGTRPKRAYGAIVISAPVDADLLDSSNWKFSDCLFAPEDLKWMEGSMVLDPDGRIVNLLRTNARGRAVRDKAAIVHVEADGSKLSYDEKQDFIDMPGGGVKFTVRYDKQSQRYWSIVNQQTNPSAQRNHLVLSASEDLRHWTVVSPLLFHPSRQSHAWQYVDWQFEGEDIVFVSRTAFDDGLGGARRGHDANYLTFHRIPDFRNREPGLLTED